MTKITYIWHDCFVAETASAVLVFDYWRDPTVAEGEDPAFLDTIPPGKPVYVFVSHFHKDHFNRDIFRWQQRFPAMRFFISKDTGRHVRHMLNPESIYRGYRPAEGSVKILKPLETFSDGIVDIHAFGSTDIGNSWLVECDGTSFFHAGDLNAWVWMDESTQPEIDAAIRDFRKVLDTIKKVTHRIDFAMFPVDARIGSGYYTGASIFVREFDVSTFIPMHFGLGADDAEQRHFQSAAIAFDRYANPERGEYVALTSSYSCILKNPSHNKC